jgi:hypothetical protein
MAGLLHFTVVFLALLERLMKLPDNAILGSDHEHMYPFMTGLYMPGSPFGPAEVQRKRTAKEMARLIYRRPQSRRWFAQMIADTLKKELAIVIPATDSAWLLIEEALELTAPVTGGFTTLEQAMTLIAEEARKLVPPDGV